MDHLATQVIDGSSIKQSPRVIERTPKRPYQIATFEVGNKKHAIFKGINKVGRHRDNDVVVENITVSKVHAEIEVDTKNAFVCDLNSSNKTRMNDEILRSDRYYQLLDGSKLTFGSITGTFLYLRDSDESIIIPDTPASGIKLRNEPNSTINSSAGESDESVILGTQQEPQEKPVFIKPLAPTQTYNTKDGKDRSAKKASKKIVDKKIYDLETQVAANTASTANPNVESQSIYDIETQHIEVNSKRKLIFDKETQKCDQRNTQIYDIETQKIDVQDVKTQKTGLNDVETQRIGVNDANLFDIATQRVQSHQENSKNNEIFDIETQHIAVKPKSDDIYDIESQTTVTSAQPQNHLHDLETQKVIKETPDDAEAKDQQIKNDDDEDYEVPLTQKIPVQPKNVDNNPDDEQLLKDDDDEDRLLKQKNHEKSLALNSTTKSSMIIEETDDELDSTDDEMFFADYVQNKDDAKMVVDLVTPVTNRSLANRSKVDESYRDSASPILVDAVQISRSFEKDDDDDKDDKDVKADTDDKETKDAEDVKDAVDGVDAEDFESDNEEYSTPNLIVSPLRSKSNSVVSVTSPQHGTMINKEVPTKSEKVSSKDPQMSSRTEEWPSKSNEIFSKSTETSRRSGEVSSKPSEMVSIAEGLPQIDGLADTQLLTETNILLDTQTIQPPSTKKPQPIRIQQLNNKPVEETQAFLFTQNDVAETQLLDIEIIKGGASSTKSRSISPNEEATQRVQTLEVTQRIDDLEVTQRVLMGDTQAINCAPTQVLDTQMLEMISDSKDVDDVEATQVVEIGTRSGRVTTSNFVQLKYKSSIIVECNEATQKLEDGNKSRRLLERKRKSKGTKMKSMNENSDESDEDEEDETIPPTQKVTRIEKKARKILKFESNRQSKNRNSVIDEQEDSTTDDDVDIDLQNCSTPIKNNLKVAEEPKLTASAKKISLSLNRTTKAQLTKMMETGKEANHSLGSSNDRRSGSMSKDDVLQNLNEMFGENEKNVVLGSPQPLLTQQVMDILSSPVQKASCNLSDKSRDSYQRSNSNISEKSSQKFIPPSSASSKDGESQDIYFARLQSNRKRHTTIVDSQSSSGTEGSSQKDRRSCPKEITYEPGVSGFKDGVAVHSQESVALMDSPKNGTKSTKMAMDADHDEGKMSDISTDDEDDILKGLPEVHIAGGNFFSGSPLSPNLSSSSSDECSQSEFAKIMKAEMKKVDAKEDAEKNYNPYDDPKIKVTRATIRKHAKKNDDDDDDGDYIKTTLAAINDDSDSSDDEAISLEELKVMAARLKEQSNRVTVNNQKKTADNGTELSERRVGMRGRRAANQNKETMKDNEDKKSVEVKETKRRGRPAAKKAPEPSTAESKKPKVTVKSVESEEIKSVADKKPAPSRRRAGGAVSPSLMETSRKKKKLVESHDDSLNVTTYLNDSRRQRVKKHAVIFTGIDVKNNHLKAIESLGGTVTDDPIHATILVTDKVRRTYKFMCAISKSLKIVSIKWLDDSQKSHQFLESDKYILNDLASEIKFDFNLRESLEAASKHLLFKGYTFIVTPKASPGNANEFKGMIQVAGGKVIVRLPRTWTENTVIISCEEDIPKVKEMITKIPKDVNVPIVTSEFILSGILKQKSDFESHQLYM